MFCRFPRIWKASAVAAIAGVLGGCATSRYNVKVDSLSGAPRPGAHSYQLKSADPALGEENLRYKEAADYVRTALSGKGYYESPDPDEADMVVELAFGMEAPRTKVERVSVPVYAPVGGVRYDTIPVVDSQGRTTLRRVMVHDPLRPDLVGYDNVPQQVTVYEKYLRITARENKPAAEGRPPAELWSVQASAEDESNDLRKYLPIMASATMEYIGKDTDHQTIVRVNAAGEEVEFIRRRLGDSPGPNTPGS